ncbi:MAG: cytochrome P460 family protein [Bryobacteraceae bacterium]
MRRICISGTRATVLASYSISMTVRPRLAVLSLAVLPLTVLALAGLRGAEPARPAAPARKPTGMTLPRFSARGQLLRPEHYREWIFAGSSLGMGYREGAASGEQKFHNVYLQPEAYRSYAATGAFPDKTILVMEVVTAGSNASINRTGHFEDRFAGIEVAVKDRARFPEQWAYFNFIGSGGEALAAATAFPKESCWNCHHQHAAADNVFVQFYPVLKAAWRAAPAK